MKTSSRSRSRRDLAALAAAVALPVSTLVCGAPPELVAVAAAIAVTVLVVRGAARENRRINDELTVALSEQRRLAETDPLTGLHNRRQFEVVAAECGPDEPFALLVVDLDHFKTVNDAYGHPAGDAVLREAAARLRDEACMPDLVARYGGEEFVVLLHGASEDDALAMGERMRRAIAATPFVIGAGVQVRITASIGAAAAPGHAANAAELLRVADRALYQAKADGRDRVRSGSSGAHAPTGSSGGLRLLEDLADRMDARSGHPGHSRAVGRWAAAVAQALGLDAGACRRVALAGRFHDIGLVGVPEERLKPAPDWTPADFELLGRHAAEGARIAAMEPALVDVAPLIAAHHERLDGRGANAMEASELSIEARILCVCEAWTVLQTGRLTGTPLSVEDSRAALAAGAGTAWDETVIHAFLEVEPYLDDHESPAPSAPDAVLTDTASAAARHEPRAPEPGRRAPRSRGWLLAGTLATMVIWAVMAVALNSRADTERERVMALGDATEDVQALESLGWRGSLRQVSTREVLDEGVRLWRHMRSDIDRADAPGLVRAVDAAERDVGRRTAQLAMRPQIVISSAAGPIAKSLKHLREAIAAERDRRRQGTADADRLAGLHTLGGGLLALALVVLLLRAYVRSSRAATRLGTIAAHAEGERQALAQSERRVRALVEHSSDCVVVIDPDGTISYATDSLETLLGHVPADAVGRPAAAVLDGPERDRLAGLIAGTSEAISTEARLRHRNGDTVQVELRLADRRDDPDVRGLVVTLRDIGEWRRLERELRATEVRDPGTGLANRVRFEQWVTEALAAGGDEPALAAIVLDLNDLQVVNESMGYEAGDRCLAECAERLSAVAGPYGRLARLAGDEFALLVERVTEPAVAERWARSLLDALVPPVVLRQGEVPLTASAGVALAAPGGNAQDLVRAADTAVHAATRRGPGHIELFSPAMHTRARRRLELRAALARAIDLDELTIAYQPIVDVERGRTTAVEALLRWDAASPADFIPVAEASGLIVPLGARVLERACSEVAALGAGLSVSVNVSAVQLRSPGFVDTVRGAVERSGLEPHALVLELTESAMLDDMAGVRATLAATRALGVRLAIDDFGTGWSSLATLASLPVDVLKLDRSFVAAMQDSRAHEALLGGVISMAERIGLPTVVEGVETQEQLERLRALGGRLVQGFHLGRPGPLEAGQWMNALNPISAAPIAVTARAWSVDESTPAPDSRPAQNP